MLKSLFTIGIAVAAMSHLAVPASAQSRGTPSIGRPSSNRRPTTSSYLNLLNNNNSIGFNYFQRVRPEQEFRNANQQLGQSVDTLGRNVYDLQDRQKALKGGLRQTGHVPRFMDLRGYFPGFSGSRRR